MTSLIQAGKQGSQVLPWRSAAQRRNWRRESRMRRMKGSIRRRVPRVPVLKTSPSSPARLPPEIDDCCDG